MQWVTIQIGYLPFWLIRIPGALIRMHLHRENTNKNSKKSFHHMSFTRIKCLPSFLLIVHLDVDSLALQRLYVLVAFQDTLQRERQTPSPAQLARAQTQTPVSKNQLCVKLVNIVLLVKLLIHVFWYVRKNSSSTFKTLSHSMTMAPLKHETFAGARMDKRFFTCARFPSRFIFKLDQFVLQITDGSKIWNSILVG